MEKSAHLLRAGPRKTTGDTRCVHLRSPRVRADAALAGELARFLGTLPGVARSTIHAGDVTITYDRRVTDSARIVDALHREGYIGASRRTRQGKLSPVVRWHPAVARIVAGAVTTIA